MDASTEYYSPETFEHQLELRFEKPAFGAGHSKRHGIVFIERPPIIESRVSTESDGTWEYLTPPPLQSVPTHEWTEAQKVIMMYRMASMESTYSANSDRTMVTPPPIYSGPLSLQTGPDEAPKLGLPWEKPYTPIIKSKDARITNDPDRQRGLIAVFHEAMDTANKHQQYFPGNERIPCPRAGCGDILASAQGLMYHLHLHDIDNNLVTCPRCKTSYEHSTDTHHCGKSRLPLLGGLLRVFSKITCHSTA